MIDRLNAAPPQDFDTAYIAQQVNAHRKAAELFDGYAEEGENEALKQFAANTCCRRSSSIATRPRSSRISTSARAFAIGAATV
jgi:predicted outer membrane protein